MKYIVTFVKYHDYEIEAKDEKEAFDKAYREYCSDMRSPIADTTYDDMEVLCDWEDDEE